MHILSRGTSRHHRSVVTYRCSSPQLINNGYGAKCSTLPLMAILSPGREQHIAVFGESGSGKTVLLSSFFGHSETAEGANDLWDLVAAHADQGNRLLQNYLGMRDRGVTPLTNRFVGSSYTFDLRFKSARGSKGKKSLLNALQLTWHDYPGEWFQQEPQGAEEREERTATFRRLLTSDVALLLVDGQTLLEHEGEEARYLKSLFGNFRQSVLRLRDDLLANGEKLTEFPRIWIIALSKADLHPDWDVDTFRELLIREAAGDVAQLRRTLSDFVEAPDALSLGEDFLLLSSGRFQLRSDDLTPEVIDLSRRIGLDLVLPVSLFLPLERRTQWAERLNAPLSVLDTVADNADVIAAALLGQVPRIQRFVAKLPNNKAGLAARGMARVALPLLSKAAEQGGPSLKRHIEEARAEGDNLRAALAGFKLDLEQGREARVIRTAK